VKNMLKLGSGVRSLNSILSSFSAVVEDLQKLQVANHNMVQLNNQRMERIKQETESLKAESEHAARVEENISKLLL
jgi:hypothetical protein